MSTLNLSGDQSQDMQNPHKYGHLYESGKLTTTIENAPFVWQHVSNGIRSWCLAKINSMYSCMSYGITLKNKSKMVWIKYPPSFVITTNFAAGAALD